MSSNCIGTVNDFKLIRQLTYQHNAWLLLDAVHYAPHFFIDVKSIGCDFLVCSAYKFYGPHVGILYSKPGLLDGLPIDRLRTADQAAPFSIETGTLNHAAIAGVRAAADFIASLGSGSSLQQKIIDAVTPFTVKRGTPAAFMSTENGRDIQKALISYVANFVQIGSGKKFNPHVTIGVATIPYLKKMLAEPFEAFTFSPAGASVYQLGAFGTARKELKVLALTP